MKGYRTIAANAVPLAIMLTDYFIANAALFNALIDNPKKAMLVIAGINVLNLVLRFDTTGPVGKK